MKELTKKFGKGPQPIKWNGLLSVLLIATLLLIALVPLAEAKGPPPDARAHPLLFQIAEETPDSRIRVIVQIQRGQSDAKQEARKHGGVVLKDLPMINSFVLELPARAVEALAQAPGVRWVSLDAPVVSASTMAVTLHPTHDTWLAKDKDKENYGDSTVIAVEGENNKVGRALLRFDLSSIPAGVTITSATLTLEKVGSESADNHGVSVHAMLDTGPAQHWTENGATWKTYDGANSWSGTGADGDFDTTAVDTQTVEGGKDGPYSWNVTSLVQDWHNGILPNRGMLLKGSPEETGNQPQFDLSSREGSTPPQLIISYDSGIGDEPLPGVNLLPQNYYLDTLGVRQLWDMGLQGGGITVAVVDSGIAPHHDLAEAADFTVEYLDYDRAETVEYEVPSRVRKSANFTNSGGDHYGHGTHLAGIIGGNGASSGGAYMGMAPLVNLLDVKISDNQGMAFTSAVVDGLQWIYDNRDLYNIRVVNLSLNSTVPEPYHVSPLSAAVEILWFNGIVVVVSAGNNGDDPDAGTVYPPANDPFVITVGATDEMGTADRVDDVLAAFSAYGMTEEGFAKPDLVAPGRSIVSLLASLDCEIYLSHPAHRVNEYYFRMSGTSMAAAVTTGAVVLLLQDEPYLTPDQVKYRLMATAGPFATSERTCADCLDILETVELAGAGYLDIYAAVHGTTTESANIGIVPSKLLWTGEDPIVWDSVNWNSVNWNSVNWNSVNWNSVNWNSVNWNSSHWDD